VRRGTSNTFDFDVTVKSVDKGARYYADAIEVLAPDGKLLGRRALLHDHEDEQPFAHWRGVAAAFLSTGRMRLFSSRASKLSMNKVRVQR
jgi:hypothetical protein